LKFFLESEREKKEFSLNQADCSNAMSKIEAFFTLKTTGLPKRERERERERSSILCRS
jgi:hypothetical protein